MRKPELKALARERRLRGYSRLRKAELIAFLQDNEPQAPRRQSPNHPNRPPLPPPRSGAQLGGLHRWLLGNHTGNHKPKVREPKLEEAHLTKRQLKHRRNKDSKLAKEFKRLEADIDNLNPKWAL